MILAALAALGGAAVQSATGFGFALVLSPALFAVFEPAAAVTSILLLALLQNCLVLFGERRRPRVRWPEIGPLLLAAPVGLVAGALLLRELPKPALQVAVGLGVIGAAMAQALTERRREPAQGRSPAVAGAGVGVLTGGLATTTALNGPPIVLWLRRSGASASEVRDSLAAAFLAMNVAGPLAILLVGDGEGAIDPEKLLPLLPAVLAGHLIGQVVFERLDQRRFARAVLAVAVAAGAASVAAGLA